MNINYKSPIKKNLLASIFGFGIQMVNQLLLIPFYLTIWGVKEYGDWILLTTIATMFSMTDAGLSSVTQNRFCIDYSQQRYNICNSLLTNNILLITIVSSICLIGAIIYLASFNIINSLGLHVVNIEIAEWVFILMIISVFIKMGNSPLDSIYRATSQAHKAIIINQINTVLNLAAIIIGLFTSKSMLHIAVMTVISDMIISIYKYYDTKKIFRFEIKFKYINRKLFKGLLIPSLTFMNYPLSNIIIYQGFTILVNKFLGAEAMVSYNTIRTLTSFVKKCVSMIQVSVWPEYSIAFGKNDINRMRSLHRKAFSVAVPLTILSCLFILIFGKSIYEIWTNNKIIFNFSLAFSFCLLIIARNIWDTSNVVMVATNKHTRFSTYYLLSSFLALIIAIIFVQIYNNVNSFVYSQLIIDILLAYYVIKEAMKLTHDNIKDFILSPINSIKLLIKEK